MQSYFIGLICLVGNIVAWSSHSPLIADLIHETGLPNMVLAFSRPVIGSIILITVCKAFNINWKCEFKCLFSSGVFLLFNFQLIQMGIVECATAGFASAPMLIEAAGAALLLLIISLWKGSRRSTILARLITAALTIAIGIAIWEFIKIGVSLLGVIYSVCCALTWGAFSMTFERAGFKKKVHNPLKLRIAQTTALLIWVSLLTTPFGVYAMVKNNIDAIVLIRIFADWRFLWITVISTGAAYLLYSITINTRVGADGASLGLSLITVISMGSSYILIGDKVTPGLTTAGLLCVVSNALDFLDKNPLQVFRVKKTMIFTFENIKRTATAFMSLIL